MCEAEELMVWANFRHTRQNKRSTLKTKVLQHFIYRPFHKTLPKSTAFINRISVKFYETDCILYKIPERKSSAIEHFINLKHLIGKKIEGPDGKSSVRNTAFYTFNGKGIIKTEGKIFFFYSFLQQFLMLSI